MCEISCMNYMSVKKEYILNIINKNEHCRFMNRWMLINNIKRCFHLNCSHTTDEMKIRRGKKNININEAGPVLFSDWFLINSVNKVSGVMTGMCRCVLSPRIGSNLDSLHRIECNLWWSFWWCWIRNQGQCCIYLQSRNYIHLNSKGKK